MAKSNSKIGKREQTGRGSGTGEAKTPCPSCGDYYLKKIYWWENGRQVPHGWSCPGCDYIAKNQKGNRNRVVKE